MAAVVVAAVMEVEEKRRRSHAPAHRCCCCCCCIPRCDSHTWGARAGGALSPSRRSRSLIFGEALGIAREREPRLTCVVSRVSPLLATGSRAEPSLVHACAYTPRARVSIHTYAYVRACVYSCECTSLRPTARPTDQRTTLIDRRAQISSAVRLARARAVSQPETIRSSLSSR